MSESNRALLPDHFFLVKKIFTKTSCLFVENTTSASTKYLASDGILVAVFLQEWPNLILNNLTDLLNARYRFAVLHQIRVPDLQIPAITTELLHDSAIQSPAMYLG